MQKFSNMSYRIILGIVIAIFAFYILYIFSHTNQYRSKESYENSGNFIDKEKTNRECQIMYIDLIRGILTGPSINPKIGYVSNKDVFASINAVENTCRWNNKSAIENKYAKFQKILADTSDKNQINKLLIAIS